LDFHIGFTYEMINNIKFHVDAYVYEMLKQCYVTWNIKDVCLFTMYLEL
jgi:hypothetical protein